MEPSAKKLSVIRHLRALQLELKEQDLDDADLREKVNRRAKQRKNRERVRCVAVESTCSRLLRFVFNRRLFMNAGVR